MKKLVFLFTLLTFVFIPEVNTSKVLFIGNSFTNNNNMPILFKKICMKNKKKVKIDKYAPGGYSWSSHCYSEITESILKKKYYDYVIFQEQSFLLSTNSEVYNRYSIPYLKCLIDKTKSKNILLYITWGYQNEDYYSMQERLVNGYNDALKVTNNGILVHVGNVWMQAYEELKNELYNTDKKHPSKLGSLLSACVHYRTIYKTKSEIYCPKNVDNKKCLRIFYYCNYNCNNEFCII